MPKTTLGELEELVLLAILRVGDDAYGVPIIDELGERADRRVAPAAVYVTLRRLEDAGLIRSQLEEPARGKPRRFVELTEGGIELLKVSRRTRMRMWDGLEPMLGES
jgi:DNA-binding PadR family transcriptional regulator